MIRPREVGVQLRWLSIPRTVVLVAFALVGGCSVIVDGKVGDLPSMGADGGMTPTDSGHDAGYDAAEVPDGEPPDTGTDAAPDAPACVPTGPELCDGVDNDCNDAVDDDVTDCTFENAAGICAEAICSMGACDEGFLDCEDDTLGCETVQSWSQCSCGVGCGLEEGCFEGSCEQPPFTFYAGVVGGYVQDIAAGGDFLYVSFSYYSNSCATATTATIGETALEAHGRSRCSDVAIAQFDVDSGALNWVRQLWTDDGGSVSARGLAATSDGDVVVGVVWTGSGGQMADDPTDASDTSTRFNTARGSNDGLVMLLDSDGDIGWRRSLAGTGQISEFEITTDDAGDVFVAGTTNGELYGPLGTLYEGTERGKFFMKLSNADGSYRTASTLPGGSNMYEISVDLGSQDRLWVAWKLDGMVDFGDLGTFEANFHQVIVEVDADSLEIENIFLQDAGACPSEEYYSAIGASPSNELVSLTGCDGLDAVYFEDTPDETRLSTGPHVILYDEAQAPVGALLWGERTDIGDASDAAVDAEGYFISGRGMSEDDYGGGALPTLDRVGAYLTRYDLEGEFMWSRLVATDGACRGDHVISDGDNGAFWVLNVRGTADLSDLSYTATNINGDDIIVRVEAP